MLQNVYRISAGKLIKRHYVSVDNLKKESLDGDASIDSRLEYMKNVTSVTSVSTKEQVAAAEFLLKIHGRLKNDSEEIEKQKAHRLKANADVSAAKAAIAKQATDGQMVGLNKILGLIDERSEQHDS